MNMNDRDTIITITEDEARLVVMLLAVVKSTGRFSTLPKPIRGLAEELHHRLEDEVGVCVEGLFYKKELKHRK